MLISLFSIFFFFLFFLCFLFLLLFHSRYTDYRDSNSTVPGRKERWKKMETISPHNKLVQEPEGNEENGYADSDSNKTKRNYTKEPNEAHTTT
jgi:hypothetical protein